MKKILLLITLSLFILGCSNTETTDLTSEDFVVANMGGGTPCGKGQQLPCPPTKHYDWSGIQTLLYHSNKAMDVVIISEGFTSAEKSVFDARALDIVDALENNGNMPSTFNYYSNFIPSPNSGINVSTTANHPATPSEISGFFETPLMAYSNALGITRYFGLYHERRFWLQEDLIGTGAQYWDNTEGRVTEGGIFERVDEFQGDANNNPSYFGVYVIVILNSPYYGAFAEFLDVPGAATADVDYFTQSVSKIPNTHFSIAMVGLDTESGGANFKELVRHETGHSIWNLADLYTDTTYLSAMINYEPMFYNASDRYNVASTNTAQGGQVCNNIFLPERWVDCDCFEFCSPPSGTSAYPYIHGAWYNGSKYKSSNNSKMQSLGQPFSPLEREIAVYRTYHDIGAPFSHPYMH